MPCRGCSVSRIRLWPALAHRVHQVPTAGGDGLIAPLAGVTMVTRPLLGQSVQMVESRSMAALRRGSAPGPGQQLPASPDESMSRPYATRRRQCSQLRLPGRKRVQQYHSSSVRLSLGAPCSGVGFAVQHPIKETLFCRTMTCVAFLSWIRYGVPPSIRRSRSSRRFPAALSRRRSLAKIQQTSSSTGTTSSTSSRKLCRPALLPAGPQR